MLVHDFLSVIEELAPASLAEEWDNVGLQAGSRVFETDLVLVALNVSDEVISEAVAQDCGIILTHHPLIFAPISSASEDNEAGRLIGRAARENIAVVAAHTNLDSARGGLADILTELLQLRNVQALRGALSGWLKLVAFVPEADLEQVRAGIFDAGAGIIGDYEHCSWVVRGQGSFLPMEGATPSIGRVGRDEKVDEFRLEAVVPVGKADKVIEALVRNHSYEEPAYDVYPLQTALRHAGAGRIGDLDAETPLGDVAAQAAELFGIQEARHTGDPARDVRRIAIVPGSGADLMDAASVSEADVLITGDFRYHHALKANELDLALIDIPHDVSERAALEGWLPALNHRLEKHRAKAMISRAETSPWRRALRREREHETLAETEEKAMFHLHVDGGSRGNPGPAGIGAVLVDSAGERVDEIASYIGEATNNVAEYQALIAGLEMALDRGIRKLAIFSDSELMVRQIEGVYKVKNEGLKPFHQTAKTLLARLEQYELSSIPRESNAHADRLVNQALDAAGI